MQEIKATVVIDSVNKEYLTRFWHVPSRNLNFTGRGDLLGHIGERLSQSKPLVVTACHGLGGVGKTQLVTEYAHRNKEKYARILWIPSETREQIEAAYLSLGQDLKIIPEKMPPAEAIERVKTWLLNHPRNLVIFDNAPDSETVEPYILSEGADVLITSRYTEWPEQGIAVDVFSLDEAVEYYRKVVGVREEDIREKIECLAMELGKLPLALAQASAYIRENHISIEEYLDLFKKKKAFLLSKALLPENEEHAAVYVTWDVTMEKIKEKSLLASELLNACSNFHSENIPTFLLEFFSDDEEFNPGKKEIFEEVRGCLCCYSMINFHENNDSISLHRLVQEVVYQKLTHNQKIKLLKKAVFALNAFLYLDSHKELLSYKRVALPHLEFILPLVDRWISEERDEEKKIKLESLFLVLKCLDNVYQSTGQRKKQISLIEREHEVAAALYGGDSIQVTQILIRAAVAHRALGEPQKGKDILERALLVVESLGDKEWLIKCYGDLSNIYRDLGLPRLQKETLEKAYAIAVSFCESSDVVLAKLRVDLAAIYGDSGEPEKEIEFNSLALPVFESKLGRNHPMVAVLLTGSGISYRVLGNLAESEKLLKEAVAIYRDAYNPMHSEVAIALTCLGNTYNVMGEYQKQKEAFEEALKIKLANFAADHFQVGRVYIGLSKVSAALNNKEEEKDYAKKALEIMLKHHSGISHPDLIEATKRAAEANREFDLEYSVALSRKVLKMTQDCYGVPHKKVKDVVIELFDLGMTALKQKEWGKARMFYEIGLSALEQADTRSWCRHITLDTQVSPCEREVDINLVLEGYFFLVRCCYELNDEFVCENMLSTFREYVALSSSPLSRELLEYTEKYVSEKKSPTNGTLLAREGLLPAVSPRRGSVDNQVRDEEKERGMDCKK